MAQRDSCRSCRHCHPAGNVSWCQLRKLSLHPELTAELSCHHWTARPPELPDFHGFSSEGVRPNDSQQLPIMGLVPLRG